MESLQVSLTYFHEDDNYRVLASSFIKSTSTDVSNPLDYIMVAVVEFGLENFQISNFKTRRCERNLQIKREQAQ